MQLKNVIGNESLKRRLVEMVEQGRVGHAIMFIEEGRYGALPMALALAQYMSCPNKHDGDSCGNCPSCNKFQKLIHPDMHFAYPVNVTAKSGSEKKPVSDTFISHWRNLVIKNPYFDESELNSELGIEDKVGTISVAEAKEILSKMNLRAYEGENKYMIVWLPERMTTEAANKLLKIIEEPFPKTYFFFISKSPERVITTIRSRCLSIWLAPIDSPLLSGTAAESPYAPIITKVISYCLSKDLSSLLKANEEIVALGREKQKEYCLYSEKYLRTLVMIKNGMNEIIYSPSSDNTTMREFAAKLPETFFEKAFEAFESTRASIESNVNAKMVFCNLGNMLFMYI